MTWMPAMLRRRFFKLFAGVTAACFLLGCQLFAAKGTPQPKPVLSFGVIADVQYQDAAPKWSRYYRESPAKLRECVARFNKMKPNFVIELGDFTEGGLAHYDAVLPIFDKLTMPKYHVLGNHDGDSWPVGRDKVLALLGLDKQGDGKGYYDFGRAGWRFVVLNGNDVSLFSHPQGTPEWKAAREMLDGLRRKKAANAQDWNGAVGEEQKQWLDRTLAQAARANEKVIVVCHYPVYPPSSLTLWNDDEVIRMLESHPGVIAFFSAHKHEGDYGFKNGIHYLTFRGMVETRQTAYALVEIWTDSLRIIGFGREPGRVLRFGNESAPLVINRPSRGRDAQPVVFAERPAFGG